MIRYNRKLKRWETRCACGRLIWSRISRIRVYGNLSLHARRNPGESPWPQHLKGR